MASKPSCPRCGSTSVISFGKAGNGSSRFYCKSRGRTFTRPTRTVMAHRRLPPEKLRLLINLMVNDTKLKAISDAVGVAQGTAYLWRMKVYAACAEIQKDTMLSGEVWIDEKLIPVNGRLEFRFANGKKPRGVSRNQVCVACAVDSSGNRYAEVAGRGHITSTQCVKTYGSHIAKGSAITHDGIFSHDRLISFVGGPSRVYKSTARGSHEALQPINSFTAEIGHFMKDHAGIDTGKLGFYLPWVAFKSTLKKGNIDRRIAKLVRRCFETKVTFTRKRR